MPNRGRALYVAALLLGLALLQVGAQVLQVHAGFRPFAQPPVRVPYSWDMFAIRLDRCVIGWDPPLEMDGERVARWHDRLPLLEFDTVFNDADWYEAAAARGCAYRKEARTAAMLKCFRSNGEVHELGFDCP